MPAAPDSIDRACLVANSWLDRLRAYATLPLVLAYKASDQRSVIDADVDRWLAIFQAADGEHGLHSLLFAFAEFRSVFYYRLAQGNPRGALLGRLMKLLWRPTPGLEISTSPIGPGLFIAHGHATTLAADSIGKNCWVHQGVTLGWDYRSDHGPVIGDDVFIGAGAVVLGAVTVGDSARIGANAMVLCDVPAGATAVGVPARVFVKPGEVVYAERPVDETDDEDEPEDAAG
ncbi:MAG TPA: DapH/DapD/GlmU-related protein [Acidimicrobiales bacterium]|jgi:serine O-acetyltransferase|nr:DapH/DapD/GlmU-related protein [Acidimicrobiales bacterium]